MLFVVKIVILEHTRKSVAMHKTFPANPQNQLIVIFVLGFCAIPAQVVLIREFILIFGGNELIIGLFLAIWMLLTAGGSYAAKILHLRERHIPFYSLFLSWFPLVLLYLVDMLRNRLFLPGIEPGIFQILIASSLLLLPFCFLSGLLFANITLTLIQNNGKASADKAYGIESAGSMTGGLLLSLVLIYLYDNFRAAGVVATTGSILVLFSCWERLGMRTGIILSSFLLLISILVLSTGSRFARHFLFQNQDLLEIRDTPFGNLAVTSTSGQLNLFENNVLLFSTDNQQINEESVHFAMLQYPAPQKVLLVSGGVAGLTGEVLKYKSVEQLDYIEIDPVILEIGKKYTDNLSSHKIRLIEGDPRIYLRRTKVRYDVVIVCLPEPSSFQINRFYSIEFMSAVKGCLKEQGVFAYSLPLTGNYLNEGSRRIYSSLHNSAGSLFQHIRIFPGLACHFVASDRELNGNIGQLIENEDISTDYVNSYYIDQAEMERLAKAITDQLHLNEEMNTDFKPVAVSGFYQYWLNRSQMEINTFRYIILLVVLLIIAGTAIASPANSGMFAAGFTSSALQVILILSFQIVYGYIYRTIGLFTAVFMAGLAMGAMFRRQMFSSTDKTRLILLQVVLAGLSGIIPFLINLSASLIQLPFLVHLLYLSAIWFISVVTGMVFSLSLEFLGTGTKENVPAVYGADLAGASLGAFLTTILLIPVAGIKTAPYLTGLFNLLIALIMLVKQKVSNHV